MSNNLSFPESQNAPVDFIPALIGDGRSLLSLTGIALLIAGAFAIFLSATGAFLPQDVDFLGMPVTALCSIGQCRTVHFMFHDRVSFGGVLIAIAILYLWLAAFPLKEGKAWAWWTFLLSGITGFGSFLAYLGYGYLDSWHGAATLALLPIYIVGMWRSYALLPGDSSVASLWQGLRRPDFKTRAGLGWLGVTFIGLGMVGAGSVIMCVGMTTVFVPEDLIFLQMTASQIANINPHLVPLIAHDRAGFGGGLVSTGVMVALVALHARPSRNVFQAIAMAGSVGFICAIAVHFCIGYTIMLHVAPAFIGALIFFVSLFMIAPECNSNR